ncbi:MAG: DNA polymerase III subunit gamma/tau [Myxococcota bacterium]
MSYVVLARKWRPRLFEDVLGQSHVTRTLTNAIEAGRIAHAFLFTGPRGVGKTSAARILARALNCTEQDGPTPRPCGRCAQCAEIGEGRSTDVFEIDAASHTGVDNVREIIDNVRYLPSSARFKVYVIDEVHMLSTGAFNALLKTLEEPPPHVKFVLATTEVHKVPTTILSRVQRHDFRRIPSQAIVERLSKILESESLDHDPSALRVLAREADGSMRDAQSLLEQVLAFAGSRGLDGPVVREALGVVDAAAVEDVVEALLERAPARVFERVGQVHDRGLDLSRFGEAIAEELRDLLAARWLVDPSSALERPQDEVARLQARAAEADPVDLERLFHRVSKLVEDLSLTGHPRFLLEVGLASLAESPARVDLDQLLDRLDDLEGRLSPSRAVPGSDGPRLADPRPRVEPKARPTSLASVRRASGTEAGRPRGSGTGAEPSGSRAQERTAPSRKSGARLREDQSSVPEPRPSASGADFRGFVEQVRAAKPALAANLAQVEVEQFTETSVILLCRTAFDLQNLGKPETRRFLQAELNGFLRGEPELVMKRAPDQVSGPGTLADEDEAAKRVRAEARRKAARENAAVQTAASELGGSIEEVRVREEEP